MRSGDRDHGETPSLLKIQKISWARWRAPVVPATWRLSQENLLNPGGGGCSEPRSCDCTPFWATRTTLHLKKKNLKSYMVVKTLTLLKLSFFKVIKNIIKAMQKIIIVKCKVFFFTKKVKKNLLQCDCFF